MEDKLSDKEKESIESIALLFEKLQQSSDPFTIGWVKRVFREAGYDFKKINN